MNTTFLKKSYQGIMNSIFVISIVLLCVNNVAVAEDDDREILNQLYQEILNSSNAGNFKNDSMGLTGRPQSGDQKTVVPAEKTADHAAEMLQKEIEKIVKDAQLRHSEAVKFMQEAK